MLCVAQLMSLKNIAGNCPFFAGFFTFNKHVGGVHLALTG